VLTARHWTRWVKSTPSHTICLRSILILYSIQLLGVTHGPFYSDFIPELCTIFYRSHSCYTSHFANPPWFYRCNTFCGKCKQRSPLAVIFSASLPSHFRSFGSKYSLQVLLQFVVTCLSFIFSGHFTMVRWYETPRFQKSARCLLGTRKLYVLPFSRRWFQDYNRDTQLACIQLQYSCEIYFRYVGVMGVTSCIITLCRDIAYIRITTDHSSSWSAILCMQKWIR